MNVQCQRSTWQTKASCPCQPIICRMTAILRDSTVAVVVVFAVVRTRPRAVSLAKITMRKSIHGFPLVFYMGMGLRLAALRATGAPGHPTRKRHISFTLKILKLHLSTILRLKVTQRNAEEICNIHPRKTPRALSRKVELEHSIGYERG